VGGGEGFTLSRTFTAVELLLDADQLGPGRIQVEGGRWKVEDKVRKGIGRGGNAGRSGRIAKRTSRFREEDKKWTALSASKSILWQHSLLRQAEPPHLDQILRDLRDPLLALVRDKVRPVGQLLVNLPTVSLPSSTTLAQLLILTCSSAFE